MMQMLLVAIFLAVASAQPLSISSLNPFRGIADVADATLRGAAAITGAAADATLNAGAIAADATLNAGAIAADATLKAGAVAADATLKGADAVLRGAAGLAGAAVPVAANILYREPVPIVKYITESNPLSGKYSYRLVYHPTPLTHTSFIQ